MVELRIAVAEATGAQGLVWRLSDIFDRSSVTFDGVAKEVRVRSEWESRSVTRVVDALEAWLSADGLESAKMTLGFLSYTVFAPERIAKDV
jgi:hypothetical protein